MTRDERKAWLERLKVALGEAAEAAKAAHKAGDGGDEGSCNLDRPYFRPPARMRGGDVLWAARQAGVRVVEGHFLGRCFYVDLVEGQASKRTRMAETVARTLEAAGIEAGVMYMAD